MLVTNSLTIITMGLLCDESSVTFRHTFKSRQHDTT